MRRLSDATPPAHATPSPTRTAPADDDVRIEAIFRAESTRLTAVMTRILGPHNLELAEDVVQDSFVRAMAVWSKQGIPDNPSAWLVRTARNRAIDTIRRERTRRHFADDLAVMLDSDWTLGSTVDAAFDDDRMRDDQLAMIFLCCSAPIAADAKMTLILKALCGLRITAIARALLTSEAAIHKRLRRARQALEGATFRRPTDDEMPSALRTMHTALYLLFNEGYFSTSSEPIQRDLCKHAMFLTRLLTEFTSPSTGTTHALLALMCFHAARIVSRTDANGALVPLDAQDRSLWDRQLMQAGFISMARSGRNAPTDPSRYHIEAAIAAHHCSARTFDDTNWTSICNLYDRLMEVYPTTLGELSRAVAISYRDGPASAIAMVTDIHERARGAHTARAAVVLTRLHTLVGNTEEAARFRDEALSSASSDHERLLLERQLLA